MPERVSVASVIEKNRIGSDVPYLAFLDISVIDPATNAVVETLHYVNNTEDITRRGILYTAVQFSLELKTAVGTQPQITLTMLDYTRLVIQRMQNYGGGTGFPVTIMVSNSAALDEEPEVQEYFEVVTASADNYSVSWTLGTENALNRQLPRRMQRRDFCQWVYRDSKTCRYTGALAACDHTMRGPLGCKAHQNVINFGGFPNLVSSNSITR
ncbi:hypothetical protein AB6809_30025 [Paraburkholderia sp. RCC_158]|uniref:hypothetical protein n=1 Tax=Paraburkholderia sp. RCC_158 TaxID=3239220 RepID=UPI003524C26F